MEGDDEEAGLLSAAPVTTAASAVAAATSIAANGVRSDAQAPSKPTAGFAAHNGLERKAARLDGNTLSASTSPLPALAPTTTPTAPTSPYPAGSVFSAWRLVKESASEWRRLTVGTVCLLASTVCSLVTPTLFGNIIDAVTAVAADSRLAVVQQNCIELAGTWTRIALALCRGSGSCDWGGKGCVGRPTGPLSMARWFALAYRSWPHPRTTRLQL